MIVEDQSATVAFLSRPEAYGLRAGEVERIETHGAIVFLAAARAYKLKRAVRFPYMDFSTLDRRRTACADEVRINRRTAPTLYEGTTPIVRGAKGLALGGEGEIVDWLVVMHRFDQAGLFDRLAAGGRLTREMILDLADAIARFHAAAEPQPAFGGIADMIWVVDNNRTGLDAAAGVFAAADIAAYDAKCRRLLSVHAALVERRRAGGFVRHCHGDLHLRNICLIDGQPTLFDAIEFNDRIACIDTLYDLAFLLADLEHRDLRALANAALNRYLDTTADCAGLALMPLYLAGRAGIRAQTLAAGAAAQSTAVARDRLVAEARENLALGLRFADPPPPRLIAAGGLSGSGKSTLAYALAPAVGSAPGAVVLRTDVIRKQLAGIAPTGRLPPESYTKEESARVYAALMARATDILASGYAVIADAVFADPAERAAIEACARAAGVGFAGIWLDAPPPVLAARVSTRVKDASDATADVVRMQAALDIGRLDWTKVAASGTPAAVHTAATYALGLAGRRVEAD